jgi:UDP-glucose 4-epimerase
MNGINMILVTGATGFVGKALIEKLRSTNVNFKKVIRSTSSNISDSNSILVDSIDSTTDWSDKLNNIDCIIHCAARVHVMNDNDSDPLEAFREVNLRGTLNLAKSATTAGVKRFVFISSIKVNGESTTGNVPYKSSDVSQPEDPYGISKAEAEQELLALGADTGMGIVIIRPPLVYGPGVKANFAAICKLAVKGIPLPFSLIKSNKRSMVYVENLVNLICECITNKNAVNEVFLVSDNDDLSLAQLIKGLSKAAGKDGFMLPVPALLFELVGKVTGKTAVIDRLCGSLQVDINHTCNTLNWQPPFTVEQGFAETVKNFKK